MTRRSRQPGPGSAFAAPCRQDSLRPRSARPARHAAQGARVHIHIAEQTQEVDDCPGLERPAPVQWLLDRMRLSMRAGAWFMPRI